MADTLVPALTLRALPAGTRHRAAAQPRRLALPGLPALSGPAAGVYRIAALDDHGRIADQAVVRARDPGRDTVSETGAVGLRVRYDLVPVPFMIEKMVSPYPVVLVDR